MDAATVTNARTLKTPQTKVAAGSAPELVATVEQVIADVRERGDAAVRDYAMRFDDDSTSFGLTDEGLAEIVASVHSQVVFEFELDGKMAQIGVTYGSNGAQTVGSKVTPITSTDPIKVSNGPRKVNDVKMDTWYDPVSGRVFDVEVGVTPTPPGSQPPASG